MKVQILGTGCAMCQKLARNVEAAVKLTGVEAEVVKVTDLREIAAFGVLFTPGLVIDGEVKATGTALNPKKIAALLLA